MLLGLAVPFSKRPREKRGLTPVGITAAVVALVG